MQRIPACFGRLEPSVREMHELSRVMSDHGNWRRMEQVMTARPARRCAHCRKPSERLLCARCAAICDSLTSAGLYWAYLSGSIEERELPSLVRRLLREDPGRRPRH